MKSQKTWWLWLVTVLLFSFLITSCASSSSSHYELQLSDNCQSGTGQPTVCTVTLTNTSASSGDFNWTAESSDASILVNPSSGSISPGSSSNITVQASGDICPFTVHFKNDEGTEEALDYTDCSGG